MSFVDNGFEIVRGFLTPQTLKLLKAEIYIARNCVQLISGPNEGIRRINFGVPGKDLVCYNMYSPFTTEALSTIMQDEMERITQKRLYQTYSVARIYKKGDVLYRHSDRLSCEYSATIVIDASICWPIYVCDDNGKEHCVYLNEGDFLVYRGFNDHWRDKYEGEEHVQFFLHWVDADGKYSHLKFDGRQTLGLPAVINDVNKDQYYEKN